jgi:hypothetical protein
MATILQDPTRSDSRFRAPVPLQMLQPIVITPRLAAEPAGDDPNNGRFAQAEGGTCFDLESPGGYLRTVTGTVAFFDREAETYMVQEHGGALRRVPVREIKATRGATRSALASGSGEADDDGTGRRHG